ncbi:hypothetical protein QJ445_10685 [Salmonella enterica]|nr:hypothetical protein [Salmonella enterica]MDL4164279.1 hypothetical protein [Salmonella enterica]MDL4172992.1 hypothetical protein [Salmonella enterica]MDL4203078.1 hypothetical protein [Salmonella enterica]
MFHLDNNSGVSAMPPVGTVQSSAPRWFTEGGGGTPASYPGADWYNIIQAELLNFLSAYGIAPDKADLSQLQKAIEAAIKDKATAKSPLLTAIAALVTSADKMPYFNGKDTVAMTALTAFAREVLAQTDAAGVLSKLGIIDGLDFTGDISAPNMRGSTSLTVGDGTGGLTNGGVDGAGFDGNNLNIKSWNGIGFQCSSDKVIRAYISTKLGIIAASEYVYAGSANLYKNGDVYGDKWSTGNGANWLSLYLEQLDSQIRNNLTSWTSNNFPTKADVSVALSGKPGRQYIKEVGVYQNDKTKPFMLHDDNSGIFLAPMSSVHLDANGWHRDASTGLITQWGSGNVPGSQQQRVNFPMAFPNTCATVIASDTGGGSIALSTMSKDNGGFTVRGASSTFGFNWFAMGY